MMSSSCISKSFSCCLQVVLLSFVPKAGTSLAILAVVPHQTMELREGNNCSDLQCRKPPPIPDDRDDITELPGFFTI